MLVNAGQISEAVDGSQQMILRNVAFDLERKKHSALRLLPRSQPRNQLITYGSTDQRLGLHSIKVLFLDWLRASF